MMYLLILLGCYAAFLMFVLALCVAAGKEPPTPGKE